MRHQFLYTFRTIGLAVILQHVNTLQVGQRYIITKFSSSSIILSTVRPRRSGLFSTVESTNPSVADTPAILDHLEAASILEPHTELQNRFAVDDGYVGLGGGTSASRYWSTLTSTEIHSVKMAILSLTHRAHFEREKFGRFGRIQLGICAGDTGEAIQTLKQWVAGLQVPKGLLHGLDIDGVPVEIMGAVYTKYSTGGARSFADVRESGRGFDSLWKPGDALLETYDGDFRGVYYNVELQDGEFRQYGVLPLNLFEDNI